MTEQRHTKSVHVCPCPWATGLHETSVCTPGMCGDGPRQTQEPTNLGHPWDTGFNIGVAIEHYQHFHICTVKTRAMRVSNTVFFKHQYITNPQVTPKTLVIKAALDLTSALKGMVSCNGKTAEALEKVSKLFTKIAVAKAVMAKAKEQWNNLQTHQHAHQAVPFPRVVNRPPILASPLSKMPIAPTEADCHVRDIGERVQMVGMAS
jgi:hypothetical protein